MLASPFFFALTAIGVAAQFLVNFGVGGSRETVASLTPPVHRGVTPIAS